MMRYFRAKIGKGGIISYTSRFTIHCRPRSVLYEQVVKSINSRGVSEYSSQLQAGSVNLSDPHVYAVAHLSLK